MRNSRTQIKQMVTHAGSLQGMQHTSYRSQRRCATEARLMFVVPYLQLKPRTKNLKLVSACLLLQAPGMDLLASLPGPLPNTTTNRSEWGHLQMDSVGLVNRECVVVVVAVVAVVVGAKQAPGRASSMGRGTRWVAGTQAGSQAPSETICVCPKRHKGREYRTQCVYVCVRVCGDCQSGLATRFISSGSMRRPHHAGACLTPGVATEVAPTIVRPVAMAPGAQKVLINSSQAGCTPVPTPTNSTAPATTATTTAATTTATATTSLEVPYVPYMRRCYVLTTEYVDLVLLAYNLPSDTAPRPLQAGYVIWINNGAVKVRVAGHMHGTAASGANWVG